MKHSEYRMAEAAKSQTKRRGDGGRSGDGERMSEISKKRERMADIRGRRSDRAGQRVDKENRQFLANSEGRKAEFE